MKKDLLFPLSTRTRPTQKAFDEAMNVRMTTIKKKISSLVMFHRYSCRYACKHGSPGANKLLHLWMDYKVVLKNSKKYTILIISGLFTVISA